MVIIAFWMLMTAYAYLPHDSKGCKGWFCGKLDMFESDDEEEREKQEERGGGGKTNDEKRKAIHPKNISDYLSYLPTEKSVQDAITFVVQEQVRKDAALQVRRLNHV
jgi:hypothetical protein